MSHYRFGFALAAMVIATVYACSPTDDDDNQAAPSTVATGGSAGKGGGADAAAGTNGSGGMGGGFGGGLGSGGSKESTGGALTADAACESTRLQPEAIEREITIETTITCVAETPEPLSIYVVLDNSRSMEDNDKWESAVSALTEFARTEPTAGGEWTCTDQDGLAVDPPADLAPPDSVPLSMAIQYFHTQGVGGDECDGVAHSQPAVAMGELPGNGQAIIDSLGRTNPQSDTPTVGALTGGTRYCAQQQTANPDVPCVVVLVTDGQPNGCGLNSNCGGGGNGCVDPDSAGRLTPIASAAFNDANNSVSTFTIGMDGVSTQGFDLLNQIAIAGGSDCTPDVDGNEACNVSASGAQGLLQALNTIRESVQTTDSRNETVKMSVTETTTLPCEWEIPDPPEGKDFDEDLVNVVFTTGGMEQEIDRVPTLMDCATVGGGWHYDDPDAPTRILACPDTCNVLELVTDATVDVLFGCATKEADIR